MPDLGERMAKVEEGQEGIKKINSTQDKRMDRIEDKLDRITWLVITNLAAAIIAFGTTLLG